MSGEAACDEFLAMFDEEIDAVEDVSKDAVEDMSNDEDTFYTAKVDQTNRCDTTMGDSFFSAMSTQDANSSLHDEDDEGKTTPTIECDDFNGNDTFIADSNKDVVKKDEETLNVVAGSSSQPGGSRLVDLDFTGKSQSSSNSSQKQTVFGDLSDSDNDELIDNKKELNESGKVIRKLLNKKQECSLPGSNTASTSSVTHLSALVPKSSIVPEHKKSSKPSQLLLSQSVTAKPTAATFDTFFAIRIRNPKVGSVAFETLVTGMKKIRMGDLKANTAQPENWLTMGVLIEKSDSKKSAKGNEFMIWKVHDLRNCQENSVKVLLFGECYKEHWKLQVGNTVALVCAQIAEPDQNKSNGCTLKAVKKAHIIDLGFCPDYGTCKGTRADGKDCTNFVNLSLSDHCVYHVMSQARKLSSKRGTFSSMTAMPPKKNAKMLNPQSHGLVSVSRPNPLGHKLPAARCELNDSGTMRVAEGGKLKVDPDRRPVTKEEERANLKDLMASRSQMLGARNLQQLVASKSSLDVGTRSKHLVSHSMSDFIKKAEIIVTKEKAMSAVPRLGSGKMGRTDTVDLGVVGHKTKVDIMARKRAAAIMRSKENQNTSSGVQRICKRKGIPGENGTHVNENPTPSKKSKLGAINVEDMSKLLNRKSLHEKQADKVEQEHVDKYMNQMEKKEQVETFVTSCMSIKKVKVVSCKKCGYTSQRQSDLCLREGHVVSRHEAEKRFFRCKGCNKRTDGFGMLPTKPCKHCDTMDWERVAMKDERKISLENEKLELRGQEKKWVAA